MCVMTLGQSCIAIVDFSSGQSHIVLINRSLIYYFLSSFLTCSNALVNCGNPASTSHCASDSPSTKQTKEEETK